MNKADQAAKHHGAETSDDPNHDGQQGQWQEA